MDWAKFWNYILGDMAPEKFLAMALLMGAGALFYFGTNVKVATHKSSFKFNFAYMFRDNILRLILVFIAIAVNVLWYEDIYGVAINGKLAFSTGLSIDALTGILLKWGKEKGPLKKNRDKLYAKYCDK